MSKIIYETYPELMERRFTPAEVGLLSGVSPEKQRQYRLFKNQFVTFIEDRADTKHSRYDWEETALWALFAEVAACGFDLKSAGYFAASLSALPDLPERTMVGSMTYARQHLVQDYRVQDGGRSIPLYMFCFPQVGKPESFLNTSMGSGGLAFDGQGLVAGRFGFWINYSDFQRRLMLRYESIREEGR